MHTERTKKFLQSAQRTFKIELDTVHETMNALDELDFAKACELILSCKGRVVVSGMGKSGHVARKIASTLTSTGTPAIFLHPAEAAHGDIGLVLKGDVFVILSKSGNSDELQPLLHTATDQSVPIIAISSNANSQLVKSARDGGGVALFAIVKEEACPNDLAPTSSTTAQLVIGDALAVALLEARQFNSNDFARLHPGGTLGRKLTMQVQHLMAIGDDIPLVQKNTDLSSLMMVISGKRFGAACVVDEQRRLLGIITDGDLRRFFLISDYPDLKKTIANDLLSINPKTTTADTLAIDALHLMEDQPPKVMQLPVLDPDRIVIGMIHLHEIVKAGIN